MTVYARLHGGVLELREAYMRASAKLPYGGLREALYVLLSWLQPVKVRIVMEGPVNGETVFRALASVDKVDFEWRTGWEWLGALVNEAVVEAPGGVERATVVVEPLRGRYLGVRLRLEMRVNWLLDEAPWWMRPARFPRGKSNAVYGEGDEDTLTELLELLVRRRYRRMPVNYVRVCPGGGCPGCRCAGRLFIDACWSCRVVYAWLLARGAGGDRPVCDGTVNIDDDVCNI